MGGSRVWQNIVLYMRESAELCFLNFALAQIYYKVKKLMTLEKKIELYSIVNKYKYSTDLSPYLPWVHFL